jgi:beta-glucanase (GH16 family)
MYKLILLTILSTMTYAQEYQLEWSEDFDAPTIDREIWNFETGFSKNNEVQFYTERTKNARIENGLLILQAHKEDYGDANYTSARINTLNKKHFRYGKIEVKAKLPQGHGTWPAIWILGANHNEVGYPACGEIDIMEHVGRYPNEVYASVHFPETDNKKMNSNTKKYELRTSSDGFHTYSIEWDVAHISYFVDNLLYHTFNVDLANRWGRKNIFRKPFYLVLNLALGGKWAGEVNDCILPTEFVIDYIRYYQLKK